MGARLGFQTLLIVILGGCAVNNIYPSYRLDQNSEKGLVIASISYEADRSCKGNMKIQSMDESGLRVPLMIGWENVLIKEQFEHVFIGVIEVRQGPFEVTSFQICGLRLDSKPRVPFLVKAGRATYIGNYHVRLTNIRKGLFGEIVAAHYMLHMSSDEQERDLGYVAQTYPLIDRNSIDFSPSIFAIPPPAQ